MPITPAAIPLMLNSLLFNGCIGMKTPQLAAGVVLGVCKWSAAVQVLAPSTGTLGVGIGVAPLVLPPPVFVGPLYQGFSAMSILGPLSPLLITGLSQGLSLLFAQGIVQTTHATVGVGVGVARFTPPPGPPMLLLGMTEAGMVGGGPTKFAGALAIALTTIFSALTMPIVVAGTPNILPGAGPGIGKII